MSTHMFFKYLLGCTLLAIGTVLADKRYIPMKAASAKHHAANRANECIIDEICETEYVGELLELCKDCEISAPDLVEPPTGVKVWFTRWGIALFYAAHDVKEWVRKKIVGDPQEELPTQPKQP